MEDLGYDFGDDDECDFDDYNKIQNGGGYNSPTGGIFILIFVIILGILSQYLI